MKDLKPRANKWMLACASLVGLGVGLSVVAYQKLFAFVHNLLFLGHFSFIYDEKIHTPASGWGMLIILVPVLGSFLVTWIIHRFAFDERGLSVPEIIYSVHFKDARIRPIPAFAKTIASIISIGSGGSIGREGPIFHMSAGFSYLVASLVSISVNQRIMLIAAGSAAGTAVIFNAPIAGLLLAIELLLIQVSVYSVVLVLFTEIIALVIRYYFFGYEPVFLVPNIQLVVLHDIFNEQLILFVPFGMLIGAISVVFIRGIYVTQDIFTKYFPNNYLRHALGMLCVGLMFYTLMQLYGHYYIVGVGLSTMNEVLHFAIQNSKLLLIILVCKLMATFLTLGTGGTGGIFSPSLFIGAVLGAIFALSVDNYFITSDTTLISYVISGMAAMLAGVTGCVLTAIVLCVEITNGYQHILPVIITVLAAFITRRQLCYNSIYTLKLARRNVNIDEMEYRKLKP